MTTAHTIARKVSAERLRQAMNNTRAILSLELDGEKTGGGRTLFKSPDLEGFYFVVPNGEEALTAMKPTLTEFMNIYLKANVSKIERTQTPRQYRQHTTFGIMRSPPRDDAILASVFAEVHA